MKKDLEKERLKMEKERLKMEAAEELGLMGKLKQAGWGGLTSGETGRIGALLSGRKRRGGSGGAGP